MVERPPYGSELVARAGEALIGEGFVVKLAVALDANERTVRRMASAGRAGERYPVPRGMLRKLCELLHDRARSCENVARAIEDYLAGDGDDV